MPIRATAAKRRTRSARKKEDRAKEARREERQRQLQEEYEESLPKVRELLDEAIERACKMGKAEAEYWFPHMDPTHPVDRAICDTLRPEYVKAGYNFNQVVRSPSQGQYDNLVIKVSW